MQAEYHGEHLPGNARWRNSHVEYHDEQTRQQFRLTIHNGLLYDANGVLFDTRRAHSAHSGGGRAIFVMDSQGNLYASLEHAPGHFHHSSFLAGGPVAGAGELVVIDGVVQLVTDASGHYRPPQRYTHQVVMNLRSRGIPIDNSQVHCMARNWD
ncbi:hypothetical protein [Nocardia cyriacigeorgica]|uniref:hypothetical protein n=1 Tax=Nocardia cyriacigeorgica TaxID=135487 RepID=UPI0024579223|nr:hypothetical protein [Nocardia cyriacigeorgica]